MPSSVASVAAAESSGTHIATAPAAAAAPSTSTGSPSPASKPKGFFRPYSTSPTPPKTEPPPSPAPVPTSGYHPHPVGPAGGYPPHYHHPAYRPNGLAPPHPQAGLPHHPGGSFLRSTLDGRGPYPGSVVPPPPVTGAYDPYNPFYPYPPGASQQPKGAYPGGDPNSPYRYPLYPGHHPGPQQSPQQHPAASSTYFHPPPDHLVSSWATTPAKTTAPCTTSTATVPSTHHQPHYPHQHIPGGPHPHQDPRAALYHHPQASSGGPPLTPHSK